MVWAVSFSRWTLVQDAALVSELARVYQQVVLQPGLEVASADQRLARFLVQQGALSESPPRVVPSAEGCLSSFSPRIWDAQRRTGCYHWAGDSEDPGWVYHYAVDSSPCLGCLWRHRVEHGLGSSWLAFLARHPDLEFRWKAPEAERFSRRPLPEPGWLLREWGGKVERLRPLAHPLCPCGRTSLQPPNRHWPSWTDRQFGPLRQVVEEGGDSWSVSLSLPPARSSGSHVLRQRARAAAVGEALERWGALKVPARRGRVGPAPGHTIFRSPYTLDQRNRLPLRPCGQVRWVPVRRLLPGPPQTAWAWAGQVALQLGPEAAELQELFSHGLACGRNWSEALARGLWELVERDAVTRWWGCWCAERGVDIWRHSAPEGAWLWSVPALSGRCYIALVGKRGKGAWGAAAGPGSPQRALQEAFHNARVFRAHPPQRRRPVVTFADHSAWGWWEACPRWKRLEQLELRPLPETPRESWQALARRSPFYTARLPRFYAQQAGLKTLRMLNPDLLLLPIHEAAWPLAHPAWGELPVPHWPHPFS